MGRQPGSTPSSSRAPRTPGDADRLPEPRDTGPDGDAPDTLDEPAHLVAVAKAPTRTVRCRRLVGRSLRALAVAAAVVGVLHVVPTGAVQPARPPFDGTERFAHSLEDRTLLVTTTVAVDGDPVYLAVTPPDLDLGIAFYCSRTAKVELRVSVPGGGPAVVGGCDDRALSESDSLTDWAHQGLRPGRPATVTVTAVSTRELSAAELEIPTWAFVGIYGTPSSSLPARPAPVRAGPGMRRVATVTLDADDWGLPVDLPRPPSGTLYYAASCAGPADGLDYMIHVGGTMVAHGWCRFSDDPAPVRLDDVPGQGRDVVVLAFLPSNHGEDLAIRPPDPGARVVVSFYVRDDTARSRLLR